MMSLRELALKPPEVLLKSKLDKAITYLKNQWVALTRFTTNCSLPLDHNHAERLLRRIALSRKSSLFMSEGRGDLYAITLSLVQSCRLCQISPEAYLSDVLMRVQTPPFLVFKSCYPIAGAPLMGLLLSFGADVEVRWVMRLRLVVF